MVAAASTASTATTRAPVATTARGVAMERADTRLRAARRRRPRRRATRPAAVTGARQRYGAPVRLGRHSLRRLQERARPGTRWWRRWTSTCPESTKPTMPFIVAESTTASSASQRTHSFIPIPTRTREETRPTTLQTSITHHSYRSRSPFIKSLQDSSGTDGAKIENKKRQKSRRAGVIISNLSSTRQGLVPRPTTLTRNTRGTRK